MEANTLNIGNEHATDHDNGHDDDDDDNTIFF